MKKLNFKVQKLLACIMLEKSKAHGTLRFIKEELREARKGV